MFERAFLLLAATLLFAAPTLSASAQTDSTTLFMERLVGGYGTPAEVTAGSLPPGWTSPVPLPASVPILGSVRYNTQHSIMVYYNPSNGQAAFDAYAAQLRAAGFTTPGYQYGTQGGFVATNAGPTRSGYFCHADQSVSVTLPPNTTNDLRIGISDANRFGPCSRPATAALIAATTRVTSPLPQFTAPAGTTIVGTGSNFGMMSASASSLSSTATIAGNPPPDAILRSLTSQLQRAGWRITDSAAGRESAIAAFRLDNAQAHWRGSLALYRTETPKTYAARIDVSGSGSPPDQNLPATVTLPQVSAHTLKSSEPAILELLKRLTLSNYQGNGNAVVYIGQVPPLIDKASLPAAKPIGSTVVKAGRDVPLAYSIYYNLSSAQLQSYLARLKSAGWVGRVFPQGAMGGFKANTLAGVAMFCKSGAATLSLVAASPNAVTITVVPKSMDSCATIPNLPQMLTGLANRSPLPQLTAPAGATMRTGTPGITGAPSASGATFVTTMTLAQLLDAFTAQLAKAGWTVGASSAGDAVGSRSFTITDAQGQRWQAVMTLYRSANHADRYYSFIDLTNVSSESSSTP